MHSVMELMHLCSIAAASAANTGKNLEFPDFRNCIGQLSAWPVLYISCTRSDDF